MPRSERVVSSTGLYHTMLRGVNQQQIFEEDADRLRFLKDCKNASDKTSMPLLAYCLMSNHVHILIESLTATPGEFFRRLGVNYVAWFNWKYQRTGHLFQDRYKSEPIESESYLLEVINYIHNNPVKAGLAETPQDFRWSSLYELHGTSQVIDENRLNELVSIRDIVACKTAEDWPTSVETERGRRARYTDEEAGILLKALTGVSNVSAFQRLPKKEQYRSATLLRTNNMPIRQITRLTGLSKGVVERLK